MRRAQDGDSDTMISRLIWVPDVRRLGFEEECRPQSRLAAHADRIDTELLRFIDAALSDINGWTK